MRIILAIKTTFSSKRGYYIRIFLEAIEEYDRSGSSKIMTPLNRGFEYRKIVGAEAAGCAAIDYLARCFPAFTREEWLKRIAAGRVLLDGIAVRQDRVLKAGQLLTWVRPPWKEPDAPCSYAVLYRDEDLLAVAKPAGLPTLPGGGDFMDNTLLSLVRRHFPQANPSHRLGRGTSGIVLFTLTQKAGKQMFRAWKDRKVLKIYRTLASGFPNVNEFEVNVPIGPVPHNILKTLYAASLKGKSARSRISILERRTNGFLARVRITTGRPHQIRIHMAAAGFPLIGDPLYKTGGIPAPDSRALPSDFGYFLHHALIGFHHPHTRKWIEIQCEPPPILRINYKG
jgi:23S rRNA pseudouridine1911/1915/1917 synthase